MVSAPALALIFVSFLPVLASLVLRLLTSTLCHRQSIDNASGSITRSYKYAGILAALRNVLLRAGRGLLTIAVCWRRRCCSTPGSFVQELLPTIYAVRDDARRGDRGLTYHTKYGLNYMLGHIGIGPIDWLGDPHWAMPATRLAIWKQFGYNMLIFIAGRRRFRRICMTPRRLMSWPGAASQCHVAIVFADYVVPS